MKSLKAVRDDDYTPTKSTTNEDAENDTADDAVGNVLIALNHIAVIADDLYTALGDNAIDMTPEEIDSVLNSYEILSDLHDKYDDTYVMPSAEYSGDDYSDIEEEVRLQKEELTLAEEVAWQAMIKQLAAYGFKMAKPSKDTYTSNTKEIQYLFGIPMRAGKYADIYFVIYGEDEKKPYGIVNDEGVVTYALLGDALKGLKKLVDTGKLQESIDRVAATIFVPTPWDIIEALGDESLVRRLTKIRDGGFIGLAESTIIDTLVEEALAEDDNLAKAIADFRAELSEASASNPSHYAVRYTVFSKNGNGPIIHKEIAFTTKEKMEKWLDTAEDKVPYFHAIQATSYPTKKEDVHLDEGSSFDTFSDAKLIKWLENNWTGEKVSPVFGQQLKAAASIAKKRGLKWKMKEDVHLDEVKVSITKWNLATGQNDKFRMEVIGQDGSAVAKILDKVLPSARFNVYNDQIGFKSTAERDAASAALVKFYQTIREETAFEIDLGDLTEAFDEVKFKRLAATGLVAADDVNNVVNAMKALEAGKSLTPVQKDLIASTFQTLTGLVTGDTAVFSKIQTAAKKSVAEDIDKKNIRTQLT